MQKFSDTIREQVWDKLKKIYYHYTEGKEHISPKQIERVVVEKLHEDTQREVDYVIRNLFRLDVDNSGSIDFQEFANFLLKRHCGEIALQRMHKKHQILKGAQRKITSEQFNALLNLAYQFLEVQVDRTATDQIFKEADKDKDSFITYGEYFSYIDQYLLVPKANTTPVRQQRPSGLTSSSHKQEVKSRLRSLFWGQLRKMFNFYDKEQTGKLDFKGIEALISDALEMSTQSELEYMLLKVFQMKPNQDNSISFDTFAQFFLLHVAELGLSMFQDNNPTSAKMLTCAQFVALVRSSYSFLSISRVKDELLNKFFDKIDTNKDKLISFNEYLNWVTKFLVPLIVYGTDYYVLEDDANTKTDKPLISEARAGEERYGITAKKNLFSEPTYASSLLTATSSQNLSKSRVSFSSKVQSKLNFSDQSLALRVRENTMRLIAKYDVDKNLLMDEDEIITVLELLFKENKSEVSYVISNVFRYDRNGDNQVTHDELADFFLEVHCGEMAIQRLHRENTYKRGAQRLMDLKEFIKTLGYALKFVETTATDEELTVLFKEIDGDNDGYISYKEYFEFLRYYFGSQSYAATAVNSQTLDVFNSQSSIIVKPNVSKYNAVPESRFARLIRAQTRVLCISFDTNKNLQFERDEVTDILRKGFKLDQNSVKYALSALWDSIKANSMGYDSLVSLLLQVYFGQIVLLKNHNEGLFAKKNQQLISKTEFLNMIDSASRVVAVRPDPDTISIIFDNLTEGRDTHINYKTYYTFVQKYLGVRKQAQQNGLPSRTKLPKITSVDSPIGLRKKASVIPTSTEGKLQETLLKEIWAQLRQIFQKYDTKNTKSLLKQDLQKLINQILPEISRRELDYIFWNLFRFDPNQNSRILFDQMAPFLLKHMSEMALQKYQSFQDRNKDTLTKEEFIHLITRAYSFLPSITRFLTAFDEIFSRLDTDRDRLISYRELAAWVDLSISRKTR